jgi:hypothetical protein
MLIFGHDLDASPSYFDTVKGLLVVYCGEKGESTWVVFHTIGPYSTSRYRKYKIRKGATFFCLCSPHTVWCDRLELLEGPGTDVAYHKEKIRKGKVDRVIAIQHARPWGSSKVQPFTLQTLVYIQLAKQGLTKEKLKEIGVAPGIARGCLEMRTLHGDIYDDKGNSVKACKTQLCTW